MPAFNRIYLDTNVLIRASWPRLSTELKNLFRLARFLKVDIYLPEAVEVELEQHWIRELDEKCEKASGTVDALKKYMSDIATDDLGLILPDKRRALSKYRDAVQNLKETWGLNGVPHTSRSVEELLRMSASHHPPFKKKDVGFRDAVIYLSVIDHLLQAKDNRGALITQDEIFQHPVIAEFAKSQGVQLEIFATANEVDDALAERLEDALRKAWERDNQKVENALKGKVPEIDKFVTENLLIPEWELSWVFVGKPLGITSINVLNIKDVRTPPLVDRKAADPLQISFQMDVALTMVLEIYPSVAPQPLRVGEIREPLLSEIFGPLAQLPSREEKVLHRTLEVEGTVTPADDSYEKIQFTAVRFKSSGLGLAGGLIK